MEPPSLGFGWRWPSVPFFFSLTSKASTSKDNVKKKTKKKKQKENGESKEGQTFTLKSDLPFNFRYSYSETNPSVQPIGFSELRPPLSRWLIRRCCRSSERRFLESLYQMMKSQNLWSCIGKGNFKAKPMRREKKKEKMKT